MSDKKRKVPKLRFPGFTDDWEQRKLGDVVEKCYGGGTPQTSVEEYWTGNIPWLQSSNLVDDDVQSVKIEKYISKEAIDKSAAKMIPSHSIAIVTRVGIGKLVLMDESYTTSQDFLSLSNVMLEKQFMLYALYLLLKNEKRKGQGTSIKGITKEALLGKSIRFPKTSIEQHQIGNFVKLFDSLISLHQRKLDNIKMLKKSLLQKLFPKDGEKIPELRFPGFTDAWEQRKLGDEFQKVNERNDGSFGREHWISVAKMYFQEPEKVQSNNIDTRTYVMREGDIAFEGHPNSEFKFGRFVANDIGSGVVSELFPIYRHKCQYDNKYWKYAIQLERIMAPIFAKSITSSGNSSNKLEPSHFLRQSMSVATYEEQKVIGDFLNKFESLLSLHQRKLDHLKELKKGLLQQMFV